MSEIEDNFGDMTDSFQGDRLQDNLRGISPKSRAAQVRFLKKAHKTLAKGHKNRVGRADLKRADIGLRKF